MPITISLCMIVKNEEEVLARCLEPVSRFCDEIIVVDTGSTDATKEIAARYATRVEDFAWVEDFSAARNYAFSLATKDYIMWLDADDIIDEENLAKLQKLKQEFPMEVDIAMMQYHTAFDEAGNVTFSYYRERLMRRSRNYRWVEPVHEHIAIHGNIREFDIAVIHGHKKRGFSDRNLRIYEEQLAQGKTLTPRGEYYYARELSTHKRLEDAVKWFRQFINRPEGWKEDKINACGVMCNCYLALENEIEAEKILYQSFLYDAPRPEICCQIGSVLIKQKQYQKAIYWYEQAQTAPWEVGWGFKRPDSRDYIPYMQLCVCYDKLGQKEKAREYHEKAKVLKPQDPAVLHNESYFATQS